MEGPGEIGLGCAEQGAAQRESQSGSKYGYPDHFSWKKEDQERELSSSVGQQRSLGMRNTWVPGALCLKLGL